MSKLRAFLSGISEISKDIAFLVKNNSFPVIYLQKEQHPDDLKIEWQPVKLPQIAPVPAASPVDIGTDEENRNFKCTFCSDRISGVRSFYKKGRKPVLVLTYSGETRPGHRLSGKKNASLRFKSAEADNLFERMVRKAFGVELNDFYFQELPGCNFNANNNPDWSRIVANCMELVRETIQKEKIQCVIFTGSAAQLYFNNNAGKYMDSLFYLEAATGRTPAIVSRSPESVLALEARRTRLENDISSEEYIKAKEEEIAVKKSILQQLELIREYVNC